VAYGPLANRINKLASNKGCDSRRTVSHVAGQGKIGAVGSDETALDVAVDGVAAILGASFLTQVLQVVIAAL